MSFPTTAILDAFTRGDAATLGPNWTVGTRPAWNTDWVISSNQALGGTVNSDYYNVATYGNCEAFLTIGGGAISIVLLWRLANLNSTSFTGYEVTSNGSILQVYKWTDSSTATQLGADITQAVVSGDKIGASHDGSAITIWFKAAAGSWTSIGTFTDGTYTTGNLAIKGGDFIDDFGGGTIVVASSGNPTMRPVFMASD